MPDVLSSASFLAGIVVGHVDKLKRQRARLEYQIKRAAEIIEDFGNVLGAEERVEVAKKEIARLKQELSPIDEKVARAWKKPPADALAKLAALWNRYEASNMQALLYATYAENNKRAEKFQAAERDTAQSAEYRATSDQAKADFDKLNAKWKVPVNMPGDMYKFGIAEPTSDGNWRFL
jgi:type II secretory pathway component HofQ